MITESSLKTAINFLRLELIEILGSDLGKYLVHDRTGLIVNLSPAIWISPPPLPATHELFRGTEDQVKKLRSSKLSPNQPIGIECIIKREPFLGQENLIGSVVAKYYFEIELTQYNIGKTLLIPLQKIRQSSKWLILELPRSTPFQQFNEGFSYSSCRIRLYIDEMILFTGG